MLFSSSDALRRTRFILVAIVALGIYGLFKNPFLSGKGSFSDTGLLPFHSPKFSLFLYALAKNVLDIII